MNIIAVTACPTGIAHTYMAAEKLRQVGRKLGHQIKVETQGALGIENELTPEQIAAADVLILAADIAIEKSGRFDKVRKLQVAVQDTIKNTESIFANLEKELS